MQGEYKGKIPKTKDARHWNIFSGERCYLSNLSLD